MTLQIYDEYGILVTGQTPSVTVNGDTGSATGDTFTIAGTNGISTSVSGSTLSVSGAGVGITVAGDSGTPQSVSHGQTATFVGGAGINTVASATRLVTIHQAYDHEVVLSSAGAFDVTLSDISSWSTNVKAIFISVGLRSTVSSTQDVGYIFFNNDTTVTNYYRQALAGFNGTSVVATSNAPQFATTTAQTSPANAFTEGELFIPNPNGNTLKMVDSFLMGYITTAQLRVDKGSVIRTNNAAITRIQIRTDNHPTDTFVSGSYLRFRFIR